MICIKNVAIQCSSCSSFKGFFSDSHRVYKQKSTFLQIFASHFDFLMEFSYTNSRFKNPISQPTHYGQTINSPDFNRYSKPEKSSEFKLIRLFVTVSSLLVLIAITITFLPINVSESRKLAEIEENLMSKTKQFIDAHYNRPKHKRKLVILLGEDHAFQEDISEMFNMRDDTVYGKWK